MSIQTTIQIRIEEKLKDKASKALKTMGLDLSSGIKLFLTEVATSESIPFFPSTEKGKKLRNYDQLMKEVEEAKKTGKSFATSEEMLDDIMSN